MSAWDDIENKMFGVRVNQAAQRRNAAFQKWCANNKDIIDTIRPGPNGEEPTHVVVKKEIAEAATRDYLYGIETGRNQMWDNLAACISSGENTDPWTQKRDFTILMLLQDLNPERFKAIKETLFGK